MTHDLVITVNPSSLIADLHLYDATGSQLAFHQVAFNDGGINPSEWLGLADLFTYVRHYAPHGQDAAFVASIGVCIAEKILGEDIFRLLHAPQNQRTLRIQLPGATEDGNPLAALLARIPWEIARPNTAGQTLAERNLLVRVVHDRQEPATQTLSLQPNEPLRVLFVFAEARGARPLAARLERRALQALFAQKIYPGRRIVADFVMHGVTRERLRNQIEQNNGYHIVHWSGHGHLNLLELAGKDGQSDRISGEDLIGLFAETGGFIPNLFFLSACHSGDLVRIHNWKEFTQLADPTPNASKEATPTKELVLEEPQPGYTGTAHALLQGGVASVIAMRYAVGDEYARELTLDFYEKLLADQSPKTVSAALTIARNTLRQDASQQARFLACDHATPMLYGAEHPGLNIPKGRSPRLEARNRRLHEINELTLNAHQHFVGRTWELADLATGLFDANTTAIASITGLGGMGKTALSAETLELWEPQFDWIMLYQAKPNALNFDTTLRDMHGKLNAELGLYHRHVQQHPGDAIYIDARTDFSGPVRFERLTKNLLRAMQDEAILLVLDNFESNLKPRPEPGPSPHWTCQDPAWETCLRTLAQHLPGTRSRVLLTTRHPLSALKDMPHLPMLLGPLKAAEASLYLREHPDLSKMYFGDKTALVMRLLNASRFHPLLMDRLAKLAIAGLDDQLEEALNTLEQRTDFTQLPELFAVKSGDTKELEYLNDALETSLDQLIEHANPDARRLLWVISLANQPETLGLVQAVWSGQESNDIQQLRQIKQMKQFMEMLPLLPQEIRDQAPSIPPELQDLLANMPPEMRAMLENLPDESPTRPDLEPLLHSLVAVGLATQEFAGPEDENPNLTCHELVRERIQTWMEQNPQDRDTLTAKGIRLAYTDHLETVFNGLQHKNQTAALDAGGRALVYCVQAEAFERLGYFAGTVVTSAKDPQFLEGLLPHLRAAAEAAPAGKPRWTCIWLLADALRQSGRSNLSLLHYEQAAIQARTIAGAGGEESQQAWSDFASISGNWAGALFEVGSLDEAYKKHLESAETRQQAGDPEIKVIGSELEAYRIKIIQGKSTEVLPEIEKRLAKVQAWWVQTQSGQSVPEAPDFEDLARSLISGLDIFGNAHQTLKDLPKALIQINKTIEIKRTLDRSLQDIAINQFNRATVLIELSPEHFGEAQRELEYCLNVFQNNSFALSKVLSSLADLFSKRNDFIQAITQARRALAIRDQLPDPRDRAISHSNLAIYLENNGKLADLDELHQHQLAALVYQIFAGRSQDLQSSLHNYAVDFRRAHASSTTFTVPRVKDLISNPAFNALKTWLEQGQVDLDQLQEAVDSYLEMAQQAALEQE